MATEKSETGIDKVFKHLKWNNATRSFKEPVKEYPLDFCMWMQDNFDLLVKEHRSLLHRIFASVV